MNNRMFDIVYSELCGWGWIMYEEMELDENEFKTFKVIRGESGYNWTLDMAAKRCAEFIEQNIQP